MVTVYLVRHAESGNNARAAGTQRSHDPPITECGKRQAIELGQYILNRRSQHRRRPKHDEDDDVAGERTVKPGLGPPWQFERIYVSPMKRTLMTAAPLVAGLSMEEDSTNCPSVHVVPTIFENGGCFLGTRTDPVKDLPSETKHGLNRDEMVDILRLQCHTAKDGAASLPEIIVDPRCTEDKGWWKGGRETDEEYWQRCFSIVDWMWEQDKDCMLITHGILMDALTKILLNLDNINSIKSSFSKKLDTSDKFREESFPKIDSFDSYFLTGNTCISCFNLDHESRRAGVGFLNHPVIEPEVRTGHSIHGLYFNKDAW